MSNTKFKSLDAIKASIRAGRKYAMESNPPEDPTEQKVPTENKENVVTPADYSVPGSETKNVNTEENAVISANTPLDQTLGADESDVKATKEPEVEREEKTVSIKEAAESAKNALTEILTKAKETKKEAKTDESKKEASVDNVASNVDLSPITLSKIANAMLETEEGRRAALNSLEQYKAEQMKQASLKELLIANEIYNQHKALTKTASENYDEAMLKIAASHQAVLDQIEKDFANDPKFAESVKRAYAQGAADTAQSQAGGADPSQDSPEAAQNDVMAAINELVQAGQIDEQGAQVLAEMAAQAAQQDGNPELSPEEAMMLLQQAVQAGIIPAEVAEQLMSGGEAEAQAATPPAEQAAAAEGAEAPAQEAAKTASISKTAATKQLAAGIVNLTMQMKKQAAAEGAVDSAEATVDDVDSVIDELVANGDIAPEEADAVKDAIVEELIASEGENASDGAALEADVSKDVEGDEEISPEELAAALEEAGVTPEELEAALADVALEEGSDESADEKSADEESDDDDKSDDDKSDAE